MSLAPVPFDQPETTCASCGTALVPDQRYCLMCGQPCSPVRLAFLDVLQDEAPAARAGAPAPWQRAVAGAVACASYEPPEPGPAAWLRRNSGLLSLGAVLLLCLVVGLLIGHWTQGTSHPPQVVKVEGLSGLGGAGGTQSATGTASPAGGAAAAATAKKNKEEAQAAKEAAKETKAEKAPPPPPVKVSPTKLKKITQTTGKKHQEEINALGATPIETG